MKLIIGLGNIGEEYAETRHNIGFMCLDSFAKYHNLRFKEGSIYDYLIYKNCLFIKPRTYMNNSGQAYQQAKKSYGVFSDILVVVDDIDLPLGSIRIRKSGGDGGHKGLKSLIECIGTSDFHRLRLGIGRKENISAKEYVLNRLTEYEMNLFNNLFITINKWLDLYVTRDYYAMLDEYSKWNTKPIPSQEELES